MKLRHFVSLLALVVATSPVLAQDVLLKQPGRWAQDYTGRKGDPAIRFGTLPNGLRYAIMRNTTPSDGVAIRMRIGSGSMAERDDEQGLAHFLEHMAFRGSKNVADGEVVRMLERQGLRFGPDTNAGTSQDQTVYMFTFPKADAAALDTGLTLMREIGERLLLSPAAIDAERGVILSEERLRDVPPYQAAKANFGNALAGTRAVARWPIGTVETIKGASAEKLRRFYAANYRPDNATIIVVGNIDPDKVEAEIKARFADWKPIAPAEKLDPGTPTPARGAVEFVASGVQDQLSLLWVRPIEQRAETQAFDREQLLQLVGLTVLNNRLTDRASKPGSPYLASQAATEGAVLGAASLTQIALAGAPDKWKEALAAVITEQRQLLEQGVGDEELKRAATQILTYFQTAAANAPTRTSSDIADTLVKVVNEDQIATSPQQDLELAQSILAGVSPKDIDAALRLAFEGRGPVLFRASQSGAVGASALEQALAEDYSRPLAARAVEAAIDWPYQSFGAEGKVLSQTVDKELGATIVSFANGARLIVKQTPYEKDTVRVAVSLGSGRKGAPALLAHALWASELMPLGGTTKLSLGDITRWAQSSGKAINAALSANTGKFMLRGTTRPQDLEAELQLLTAFARDPGFRPELGEKLAAAVPMMAGQIEANAGAVFMREAQRLAGGGDTRYGDLPSAADLAATKPDDLAALLKPALAGAADVTIVGDISVPTAIALVGKTFGAGAPQPNPLLPQVAVHMPQGRAEPYTVTHGGRADQGVYGEYWALPDYYADPKLSHVADVAAAILKARLIETVREKLGLTYSPSAQALASTELVGLGYMGAMIETPPANFETFRALLGQQIEDLAAKSVSPDELKRAKTPLIEASAKNLEDNGYWLGQLSQVLRDPRAKRPTLRQGEWLQAVTASDVQKLFQTFIAGKLPVTVVAKAK